MPNPPASPPADPPEVILVVDDEEPVRRTFREWLVEAKLGAEVLTAADAESALLIANNKLIDLAYNNDTSKDGNVSRLVSVLLFIGAGLGLLAALVSMLAVGHAPGGPPAVLVGAIQVLACLLYLMPAWYLSRYAGALGSFLQGGAIAELEAALDHQKSFWKFVGILTLITIVLAVLGIAAAILVAALFVGR